MDKWNRPQRDSSLADQYVEDKKAAQKSSNT